MEPITKKKAGRELGNAAACGQIAGGIHYESYQWYVRNEMPEGNPAPGHVEIDNVTGHRMYPLKEVRAWHARRAGRGRWGGDGARARQDPKGTGLKRRRAAKKDSVGAVPTAVSVDTIAAGAVTAGTLEATRVESGTLEATTITTGQLPTE